MVAATELANMLNCPSLTRSYRYVERQRQAGLFQAVRRLEPGPLGDSHWVKGKVA